MYGEIADGKYDDDYDQHLSRFPPGTQLQFDRSVGIDGEHIFIAASTPGTVPAGSMVTMVMVMTVTRLLGKETNYGAEMHRQRKTKGSNKKKMMVSFPYLINNRRSFR